VDRASAYRETAEAGWAWARDQVVDDDGPRIPVSVPELKPEPEYRDGMHSGIGGLAHALAEIHLARPWSPEESHLAESIGRRIRGVVPTMTETTYFDGLVSAIGTLLALDEPGAEVAVSRLVELATEDGWPQAYVAPPRYVPGGTINDITLGTAAVLNGAVWALRHDVAGARELAERAADVLLGEAEETADGLDWPFVPRRFWAEPDRPPMPNLSHGLAGIAAALAVGGLKLDRADLVEAAQRGAAHYVGLADTSGGGCRVPRQIPRVDADDDANGWCHGPTGASLLFPALARAGVHEVAGRPVTQWREVCLHSVRTSGIPERLRPGFWDNDGRCCGTAGVVDVLLDAWQDGGPDADLDFALHLCDVLVERAFREGDRAWWRFVEHRNEEPLLPPGVGWMQGAAGISAVLMRAARVVEHGRTTAAALRMDNWWALPDTIPHHRGEET
jgi:hypothetical protein